MTSINKQRINNIEHKIFPKQSTRPYNNIYTTQSTTENKNQSIKLINIVQKIIDDGTFPSYMSIKDNISKIGLVWPRGIAKFHPIAPKLKFYGTK